MKIYFSASVTAGRDDEDIYEKIVNLLLKYGDVLDKHIGYKNYSSAENGLTTKQMYERCKNWMTECEIVFAEISNPSTGVGYELAYLEKLGKKIYCFYKNHSPKKISPMIDGNEYFKVFKYDSFEEVEREIDKIFVKFTQ